MDEHARFEARALSRGTVEVWVLRLGASNLSEIRGGLTMEEMERMGRLRRREDRIRYGWCRFALRCLLAAYTGLPAGEMLFKTVCQHCSRPDHGKPQLALRDGGHGIHFNVAHSGGVGVLAIGRDDRVGVDVELVRNYDDRSVEAALHPKEYETWLRVARRRRAHEFCALWVRKEAVAKAIGLGLALPPSHLEVRASGTGSPFEAVWTERYGVWQVTSVFVGRRYESAVAVSGHNARVRIHEWFEQPDMLAAAVRAAN